MGPLDGLLQAQNWAATRGGGGQRLDLEKRLAQARMGAIEQGWQQYPGRMPGGTGPTGLMSSDKYGWSQMLNEQTEHQNLGNALSGKPQSVVELGKSLTPQGFYRPLPESHSSFMRRYGR